jgi:hypothetical protein
MSEQYRTRMLLTASIAITAAIALWMHAIRSDVDAYNTVRIFLSLFLYQDYPAALLMLAVLAMALLPALRSAGLEVARFAGRRPWVLCAVTSVLLAVGARTVYQAHPLSMDEYAALFQSAIFAEGRLVGQLPPDLVDWLVPTGFQGHFLQVSHQTGHVASMYWPGFALILAPFTWLGVPWLANPLLGGLAIVLVHRLALQLTESSEAAGLAALLTLASPAVTVNAISLYSMPAHLVCNSAFVLLLLRPSSARAFLAGLVGSLALVLHNPLPHVLVAVPWLFWLCARPDRLRTVPAIALGYLPLCLILGFGWMQVLAQMGDGVVPAPVSHASHAILPGLIDRLAGLNVFRAPDLAVLEDRLMALAKIWLWAVPGLLLLSIAGARVARSEVRCRLLAWSAVFTLMGFLFVPVDQGHGWGFRYFHAAWFTLPLLAVVAIWPVPTTNAAAPGKMAPSMLAGYVAACALLSLTLMTGLRVVQVGQFMSRHLGQIPVASSGQPKVVLIRWQEGYYSADLVQNDPFMRNRPLMLVTHGEAADARLLAGRFPGLRLLATSATADVWGTPSP